MRPSTMKTPLKTPATPNSAHQEKKPDKDSKPVQVQQPEGIRAKIDKLMQAPQYEIAMTVLTFLVLYADDVRVLALSKESDNVYYIFMIVAFFIFFVELIILSIVRDGYIFGFFFWMDLLSTFSTLMEIPLVMSDLLQIQAFSDQNSTKIAKAGRASRISSRATKVIRVIRLIRLMRVAKLYKYAYKGIEQMLTSAETKKLDDHPQEKFVLSDPEDDEDNNNNILQYNQKMIPKPKQMPKYLATASPINSGFPINNIHNETERLPIVSIGNGHSTVKVVEMTSNLPEPLRSQGAERRSMRTQFLELGEKPIHYEEQQSMESLDHGIHISEGKEEKLINQGGEGMHAETETNVGKILSDLTTRRAIMVMFSIMISIPLLDYNTYFQDYSAYDTGLNYLENLVTQSDQSIINDGYAFGIDNYITTANLQYEVLLLRVKGDFKVNDTIVLERRDEETQTFSSNSGLSTVIVDAKADSQLNAVLGLIRTTFVIFVLVTGAIFFSKDSNELVVAPIESMLAKVKRISENPLEAAHIEEDMALAEEQLRRQNLEQKLKQEKLQTQQGFETVILEKLIVKTGALLAIGFGEAGSEIIGANMRQDGEVNPMIPGKKTFAIFGFCDVRNFVDMTEVLEEKVMIFVNEVADVVHSTVNYFEGTTNKNIGDAFLLVWKFPPEILRMNKDYPEILNLRMVNNLADMALLAFIKTFVTVRKSNQIKAYCDLPEVQGRLPGFTIKMGFGLHVGWAIEGAIGSYFKIDASYLSPNVNMASRLEAATKQYGVYHLVSGPFYRLLSNVAQSKMRHIDRVTVKGSIQPIDLFTYDFDVESITGSVESKAGSKNKKIQRYFDRRKRAKRLDNIRKEKMHINSMFSNDAEVVQVQEKYTEIFFSTFHDGVNSYLQGRWAYAKSCFEKTKTMLGHNDGPSTTLLNFMRTYNFDAPEDWKGYRELTEK